MSIDSLYPDRPSEDVEEGSALGVGQTSDASVKEDVDNSKRACCLVLQLDAVVMLAGLVLSIASVGISRDPPADINKNSTHQHLFQAYAFTFLAGFTVGLPTLALLLLRPSVRDAQATKEPLKSSTRGIYVGILLVHVSTTRKWGKCEISDTLIN